MRTHAMMAGAALLWGALAAPCRAEEPKPEGTAPPSGGPPLVNAADLVSPCNAPGPSVSPWFTLRHDFGQSVGFRSGFSYFEGFAPLWQAPRQAIIFTSARFVNYDDWRGWESQLGGGGRVIVGDRVILGLNGYYDGRNTTARYYNQLGLGWEALGADWEARGNFYVPVGQQRGVPDGGTASFVGTNIFLPIDTALNGVDAEVGRCFRINEWLEPKFYVGGYHYSNDRVRTANGVRGRMEVRCGDNLTAHLQVQNDKVFGTTVYGGLGISLGKAPGAERIIDPLGAKLGERVVRDPNIVLEHGEKALDPVTHRPIEVRHISSSAAPGGDGSVKRPFRTLAEAQQASQPGQVLFAHSGSVFQGQALVLQSRQRFLGEGIPHLVATAQGTFFLPTATRGTVLPVIVGSPGNAVTLASNTEVSGFRIVGPAGAGIFGTGITGVNINRNVILYAVNNGIDLANVSGHASVVSNVIDVVLSTGMNTDGIRAVYRGNIQGTLDVSNNLISNVNVPPVPATPFAAGISLETYDNSVVRATINRNVVNNVPGFSVAFSSFSNGNSTAIVQLGNNTAIAAPFGTIISSFNTATVGAQVIGNNTPPNIILNANSAVPFLVEDTLGTNTPLPTTSGVGNVTVVPFGAFGFPPP